MQTHAHLNIRKHTSKHKFILFRIKKKNFIDHGRETKKEKQEFFQFFCIKKFTFYKSDLINKIIIILS